MNSDIRKLQILNDVIAQTIDALERRAAQWGTPLPGVFDRSGLSPFGAASYPGVTTTPWGYPTQAQYGAQPYGAPHYGAYGMNNPLTNMPALFSGVVPTGYGPTYAHPAAGAYMNGSSARYGFGGVQSIW